MKKAILSICLILISSCTTAPNFETLPSYYVIEKEFSVSTGIITNKNIVSADELLVPKTEAEISAEIEKLKHDFEFCKSSSQIDAGIAKAMGGNPNADSLKKQCEKDVIERFGENYEPGFLYKIRSQQGVDYKAYSFYSGFDVGDCVNIFIGVKSNRISRGDSCE